MQQLHCGMNPESKVRIQEFTHIYMTKNFIVLVGRVQLNPTAWCYWAFFWFCFILFCCFVLGLFIWCVFWVEVFF